MKPEVVVVGGGLAGCSAALTAVSAGASVHLFERTDLLLGGCWRDGRVGGSVGQIAAAEAPSLGTGLLLNILEACRLREAHLPDEAWGYTFDCHKAEPAVRQALAKAGVTLHLERRVTAVRRRGRRLEWVRADEDDQPLTAGAFVDATGSTGGVDACTLHGVGCVMCMYRCPAYGDRASPAVLAGAEPHAMRRAGGEEGLIEPTISVFKETLDPTLMDRLERHGVVTIGIPPGDSNGHRPNEVAVNASGATKDKLTLVDIGEVAKCEGIGVVPLRTLRRIPGLGHAVLDDPKAGGAGNKVTKISLVCRDDGMRVIGYDNLFCAGDNSGPDTGVIEAAVSGAVAGYNAACEAAGSDAVVLPATTVSGAFITYVRKVSLSPGQEPLTYESDQFRTHLRQLGIGLAARPSNRTPSPRSGLHTSTADQLDCARTSAVAP